MHGFPSYTNLYDVLWTVRTLRNYLRGQYSLFIVEKQLSLQSREMEVVVLPLDFSISSLLGKVYNGVLHSTAKWVASGYHECECTGISAD